MSELYPITDEEMHDLWNKVNFDTCGQDSNNYNKTCISKELLRRVLTEYGRVRAGNRIAKKRGK